MSPVPNILDWKVLVKDLARDRLFLSYEANDKELDAIRLAYDLHAARKFGIEMELQQNQPGLIKVAGKLTASVEQVCVVTLKPVSEKMVFTFSRLFAQNRAKGLRKRDREPAGINKAGEAIIEPLEDDPPDILSGNTIDLGTIALEEFALELDPYPRHSTAPDTAGSAFPGNGDEPTRDVAKTRPFAELKKYRADKTGD